MLQAAVECFLAVAFLSNFAVGERPNVLFLIADDLRPALGCYGGKALTPNIDKLARKSTLFRHAYAQLALCGPSRTSLLTSRRPDTLRTFDNKHAYWREFAGNFTTLPQYFKENGYFTASVGKVFHPGKLSGHTDDWPLSWSEKPYHPSTQKFKDAKVCKNYDGTLHDNLVCPVNVTELPVPTLPDIQSTQYALRWLKKYIRDGNIQPFFLAIGFHKPHIPFKYPEQYKDLYPLNKIDPAVHRHRSLKMPSISWNPWQDVKRRDDISKLNIGFPYGEMDLLWQLLSRQSYYAAISYMDDLVGQILHAIASLSLENRTIIVFTSDHGWSLGEHGEWAKYSNFDVATRVPLIIHVPTDPSAGQNKGSTVEEAMELVDIFPTLVELANLPPTIRCPKCSSSIKTCTEGISLVPMIQQSNHPQANGNSARIPGIAFYQYPRPSLFPSMNSDSPSWSDIRYMGYTVRTVKFRYTEWIKFDVETSTQLWQRCVAKELYDLIEDPTEDNNVAGIPTFKEAQAVLSKTLHEHFSRNCR